MVVVPAQKTWLSSRQRRVTERGYVRWQWWHCQSQWRGEDGGVGRGLSGDGMELGCVEDEADVVEVVVEKVENVLDWEVLWYWVVW